jgi:hypothetical protein
MQALFTGSTFLYIPSTLLTVQATRPPSRAEKNLAMLKFLLNYNYWKYQGFLGFYVASMFFLQKICRRKGIPPAP